MTFSRSLAEHLQHKTGADLKRVRLLLGGEVMPGDGWHGLCAVCKRSGWPLRVTLFRDLAELWRDESRVVRQCWLMEEKGWPPTTSLSAT